MKDVRMSEYVLVVDMVKQGIIFGVCVRTHVSVFAYLHKNYTGNGSMEVLCSSEDS